MEVVHVLHLEAVTVLLLKSGIVTWRLARECVRGGIVDADLKRICALL